MRCFQVGKIKSDRYSCYRAVTANSLQRLLNQCLAGEAETGISRTGKNATDMMNPDMPDGALEALDSHTQSCSEVPFDSCSRCRWSCSISESC